MSDENTSDATIFDLTDPNLDRSAVICALQLDNGNEYNGHLGLRISSVFVILFVSTAFTLFPLFAVRQKWVKVPPGIYIFARYFGAGVIIATAFIHLLDPAYDQIGGGSCVGNTGGWALFPWCTTIVMVSVFVTFLTHVGADNFFRKTYNTSVDQAQKIEDALPTNASNQSKANFYEHIDGSQHMSSAQHKATRPTEIRTHEQDKEDLIFRQQIANFLLLEFGIIFHSVIIGLNLGVAGDEFFVLYPVLVFHQSFEGLGIGARLVPIRFSPKAWTPWLLCWAYGLTTPISIAIGLGCRMTLAPESFTANVISGVFDSASAGILIYCGLVEIVAMDFLFQPDPNATDLQLVLRLFYTLLGGGIMALIGKWA